jgi:transcription elongation factor
MYDPHPSRKRKRTSQRPPAKLFNTTDMIHYYGRYAISSRNDRQVFQKQKFYKGLLELDLFSTHVLTKVQDPRLREVKPFIDAGVVSPGEGLAVTAHETNASLRPGDAVKITSGEHAGCKGILIDADGSVAFIDLDESDCEGNAMPKLNHLLQVPIKAIQRIFRIGDNVRVRAETGGNPGPAGCITAVDDGLLSIVDDNTKEPVRSPFPSYPGL